MSVERQRSQIHGICLFPCLFISLSYGRSHLWITASSRCHTRGQGASYASGNTINAALIWPITSTVEADPDLLLQLIIQLSSHTTSCPLSLFLCSMLMFLIWVDPWRLKNLCCFPLPTRLEDSRPPLRITASINLTEVITHHPLGAMNRLPTLSSTSM